MNSKRITCTEARVSHETYSGSTLSKSQKTWRERQNIILFNIFFQIQSPICTMWSGVLRWSCGRRCSESFAALVNGVVTEARVSHKTYSGSTFSKSQKTWRERQNIILSNIFFQIQSPIRTMWSGVLRCSCGRRSSESFAALVHCTHGLKPK